MFWIHSFKTVDGLFSIAALIALFNQSFHAFRTLHLGYSKKNYSFYRNYFSSKLLFLCANSIRLLISDKDDCSLFNREEVCANHTQFNFSVDLLWSFLDFYFTIIIFSLCQKVTRGEYEQVAVLSFIEEQKIKMGIILETLGKKPDELKIKCKEISISFTIVKKEKPKYFKVILILIS